MLQRHPNIIDTQGWDELSNASLAPNACHSRAWLTPMFEAHPNAGAQLVSARTPKLHALAALKSMTLLNSIPIPIAQTWDSGFLFSGTPLISQTNPQNALTSLLEDARSKMGARAVLFKKVQANEKFDATLKQIPGESIFRFQTFNQHQRAALFCQGDYDSWLLENFSRKRRKEYRRLRQRLSEIGELKSHTWRAPNADPQSVSTLNIWIEEFLQLEASGWKGQSGTAVACSKEQSTHLRAALLQMAENNSLLFWKITLGDKVIASMFGFVERHQAWLGKIAYDETLTQYSPGVMVILDATKDLFARENITVADSSADPDHPMINNIWRDRIDVADYLIATPGTSQTTFQALVTFEKTRLKTRNTAKLVIKHIRKGLRK